VILSESSPGKRRAVDLTGYSVADAVKIIRGKQGTEVKLTVKRHGW
jgi:carboxyl-terminal processing protease